MSVGTTHLTASRFTLTIDDAKYINFVASVVDFNHPALSIPPAPLGGKRQMIPMPGDKYDWEPLVVRILIDGEMNNYEVMYDWMRDIVETSENHEHDLILTIYNINDRPVKQIRYTNAFPTLLGQVSFNANDQNDTTLGVDINFLYTQFELLTP